MAGDAILLADPAGDHWYPVHLINDLGAGMLAATTAPHLARQFAPGTGERTLPRIDDALDALEEELAQSGFDKRWEPTVRGLQLEQVIGIPVQERSYARPGPPMKDHHSRAPVSTCRTYSVRR